MNTLLKKLLGPRRMEYLTMDQDLIVLETSAGVKRFADRPDEVVPGNDVRAGFPELIGVEHILSEVLQGKQAGFEFKGIARFSDRESPLYIDLFVSEFQHDETLENQLVVFFEDVTEMMVLKQTLVQRANESGLLLSALVSSKDYIDKIIKSMADALLVTTSSGQIKTINQSSQELFQYSEEELIGQPISLIIPEKKLLSPIMEPSDLCFQSELLQNIEVDCYTKAGEKISVAFSCSVIQTDIEGVQDFVYIGRDITESKRAEAEIRSALEKEKELNEMKSNFVSMASHEFRTPLTIILTSVELLEDHYYSPKRCEKKTQQYFQMIHSAVKQMTNLLDDVLTLGKSEAGRLEFDPNFIDLGKFCGDLVEEMQLSAGKKHALTFVNECENINACMDEKLLRHILTNLLSNALKFSPPGKPVVLNLMCKDKEVIFEIQDQGIGIPLEDQKRLFELFHRARNARNISGTGLGLAIVHKSVELHGGKIMVASEVGAGTTFRVMIPWNNSPFSNEYEKKS
ncbi:sensor histidine kinase [Microcoleus sp. FACHB-672]|uniref:sensor histidine kinase n=1 Tax=Microcoleus sp. FACHB-672 TaxID=2692825 RepID=UPI001687B2B6|nr:ATP-binding protein [Microcoleus sp. FACHB-672]MBD2039999.1 PAS domain S-box protein [Microcoleus sp. FACHB-672]